MTTTPPDPWPVDTVTTYPLSPSRRGDGTVTRGEGPRTLEQHALAESVAKRREQAIKEAGQVLAHLRATCAQMTPREQAEAAWTPTSPYTVDELEDRIRIRRGMSPAHHRGAALEQLLAKLETNRGRWMRDADRGGDGIETSE